jgi:uncharacterized protein YecE (DUF72 family)
MAEVSAKSSGPTISKRARATSQFVPGLQPPRWHLPQAGLPAQNSGRHSRQLNIRTSHIRIGISGWQYPGWRGVFYPPKLVQARELEFASHAVQTIEINGSHYSLQSPSSYQRWHEASPEDFVFSIKGPRYLTHILRLEGPGVVVAAANFFASGLFNLHGKLGPILWQFQPNMKFRPDVFEAFLQLLPKDTDAAALLARKHDRHAKQPCLTPDRKRAMRHAIEIRNPKSELLRRSFRETAA